MALKESEVRVLAILGLVILVLWSFFGLFWSLLLVFTFLIYAYNFGRHGAGNKLSRRELEEEDSENDLSYQEKLHSTYQEPPDLPFTGLPREKVSLRSPMPLLSEVTKRLSFNTSTTTPFHGRNTLYNRELVPTPYPSRGSTYHRKPKRFSLLNPALQRPSTVKIASPDVTVNRTFTLSNSPLKRATDDWNPCSRVTVLSALKESRKRSFVVEDDEDELMRPTKRRDIKQVDSYPFSSPLFTSRKRVAIPESTKTTPDENFNKKSKLVSHSDSSEMLEGQTFVQKDSVQQKRKNRDSETEKTTNRVDILESTETGEDESSNKKSKFIDQSNPSETVHNQRQADSGAQKRKDRVTDTEKTNISQQGDAKEVCKRKQSKIAKSLEQQTKDDEAESGRREQAKIDSSSSPKQTKRFTVPRFASKEDSRRRAVPVYCASNEESEMPQRRTVSRKINQEQIKIDRRLAWERVKELLGGDEEEEEEEETDGASKTGTTAALSTAAGTSTSSSILKIPTARAVTSAGTITTTTTQSLITPAPSTGVPQRATGAQGGPVLQSQATAVPLLQSQQTSGPGLLANLLSNPGSSKNTSSGGGSQTATSEQAQSAVTAQTSGLVNLSKAPTIGLQTNVSLTSTVTATQGPAGFQPLASSTSSFGNSPFTKPAITNQFTLSSASSNKNTSDTNTSSAQQAGLSFPAVSSLGSSGTSSTAAGQGGFTFAVASGTQNAVSLGQNSTQNTPGKSLFNSPSTSALGAASSQKPASLSGNSTNAPSPFASFAQPTQNSSVSSSMPAPSGFGQSSNAAQTFGSASQNKLTFGVTNMQSVVGQQSQSPFGGTASNTSGFGATPAQNTFGTAVGKSSTQSPFSQGTLGAQANQNSSQGPPQNAFGAQQQNPQATATAFGKPSGKSAFANLTNTQGNFTFGSQVQQSATQNVFGNQTIQNAFGSPNQNTTQGAFRNQATQNAFGAQVTQSAFGASSTQKTSSPFTFTANAVQNTSNTTFGGFGKTGTQSTLGSAPSQHAAAPSGGFNFSATGSSPAPGGFNFNAAANKPSGFQFGAAGSSSNFGQFGQTTAQPGAAPATPTPSGGFNFAPGSGGMPGSPFASPAAAPTFGVPSTPQGTGSTLTAKSRARLAARRRGKK